MKSVWIVFVSQEIEDCDRFGDVDTVVAVSSDASVAKKVAKTLAKKAECDCRDDLSYYVEKFTVIDTYNEHLRYMGLEAE